MFCIQSEKCVKHAWILHLGKNHKFGNKESDDYFSEKTKKQKRRNNKYRDKMRYDEKYDGWN